MNLFNKLLKVVNSLFFLMTSGIFAKTKILFIVSIWSLGGETEGTEEVILRQRVPDHNMYTWYNSWWNIIQELKEYDVEFSFQANDIFCKSLPENSSEWNRLYSEYTLFIYHDFPERLNPICADKLGDKSILILYEPPTIEEQQYNSSFLKKFSKVFSWDINLINGFSIQELRYPVLKPYRAKQPFESRKVACMISGNHSSRYKGEMYSERRRIIHAFGRDTSFFSLYGCGWEKYNIPAYKGTCSSKYETLENFRFNICLENTRDSRGYITEKIFDAFEAGCIPIYFATKETRLQIPTNCYISYDSFSSLYQMKKFLMNFTRDQYLEYQKNIQLFLASEKAQAFSQKRYEEILLKEIKSRLPVCPKVGINAKS